MCSCTSENLEVPPCAIAHLRFDALHQSGTTVQYLPPIRPLLPPRNCSHAYEGSHIRGLQMPPPSPIPACPPSTSVRLSDKPCPRPPQNQWPRCGWRVGCR